MKQEQEIFGSLTGKVFSEVGNIQKLISFITQESKRNFYFVCGGGSLAREYRDKAKELGVIDADALDVLGIAVTHLNARLLLFALKAQDIDVLYLRSPITNPARKFDSNIIVTGGEDTGHTSDYIAVHGAISFAESTSRKQIRVINLGVPGVFPMYNDRPEQDKQYFKRLSFSDYLKMMPEFAPGINIPFDTEAVKLACEAFSQKGIEVEIVITDWQDYANLGRVLKGVNFQGTILTPYDQLPL